VIHSNDAAALGPRGTCRDVRPDGLLTSPGRSECGRVRSVLHDAPENHLRVSQKPSESSVTTNALPAKIFGLRKLTKCEGGGPKKSQVGPGSEHWQKQKRQSSHILEDMTTF